MNAQKPDASRATYPAISATTALRSTEAARQSQGKLNVSGTSDHLCSRSLLLTRVSYKPWAVKLLLLSKRFPPACLPSVPLLHICRLAPMTRLSSSCFIVVSINKRKTGDLAQTIKDVEKFNPDVLCIQEIQKSSLVRPLKINIFIDDHELRNTKKPSKVTHR
jgi:hypothetical protein